MAEDRIFPSRIDWWVTLLLIGAPVIHLPLGIWVITMGKVLIGVGLIVWGLILGVVILFLNWPCHYALKDSGLAIRSGMVNESIGFSRIQAVVKISSIKPAPALSKHRLKLTLSDKTERMISPKELDEFTELMRQKIDE